MDNVKRFQGSENPDSVQQKKKVVTERCGEEVLGINFAKYNNTAPQ